MTLCAYDSWEGVREMYQIITLISLMFLTWAAAIWASYAEEQRP